MSLEPSGSALQRFAGSAVAITIEVGVPLAQQLLGTGMGADLFAAVAAALAEVPGAGDAALQMPHPVAHATQLSCRAPIQVSRAGGFGPE